jgi:hypothetical protein
MGGGSSDFASLHRPTANPKLAHRNIRSPTANEVLKRSVAVRLCGKEQAMLSAKLCEIAVVVFCEQVGNRAAEIPKEPFADFHTVNDIACQDGKERR